MDTSDLASRMKNNYEKRARTSLTRRTPVIIRLDGKAFHTFTKGFDRPFSEDLNELMAETTKKLCEEIQGAKFGYTQSDEISILVTDFDTLVTDAWFDYQVQKICSVSSSIATAKFNREYVEQQIYTQIYEIDKDYPDGLSNALSNTKSAYFDARCFNIPKDDVENYFIWRQQDWVRNSIQMLGQSLYSQKELHKKNTGMVKEMCYQKEHNWADLPAKWRNGTMCVKLDSGWNTCLPTPDFKTYREEFHKILAPRE